MTCGHCAASVTEGVAEIPGISGAEADLPRGTVLVPGEALGDAAIPAAIAAAGYTIAETAGVCAAPRTRRGTGLPEPRSPRYARVRGAPLPGPA
ncbi:heavy-metal-associated domain-containing protein [Streptomyces sp. NPDC053720]|uniref:heavy-metal-associated domain-containing protein n=1 Tax=Streptomyces sp. NPDC053720 TaxID=3154855 RepID=UPI00342FE46F